MSAVRERPRAALAAAVALVAVVAVAMLAGRALAGGDSSPTRLSADHAARVRAERTLADARSELAALRGQLRARGARLATAQAGVKRWRARAERAQRQLVKARERAGSKRRSR